MPKRSANGLLHLLGAEIGLPALHLDKDGCCTLAFDAVVVNFELDEDRHRLFLYASLGPIPAAAAVPFYQELLDANLFWKDTGGATLSLDRAGGRVLLMQGFAVGRITDADFKAGVERFVNVAEAWTARVAAAAAEPVLEAAPERPPVIFPGMLA